MSRLSQENIVIGDGDGDEDPLPITVACDFGSIALRQRSVTHDGHDLIVLTDEDAVQLVTILADHFNMKVVPK